MTITLQKAENITKTEALGNKIKTKLTMHGIAWHVPVETRSKVKLGHSHAFMTRICTVDTSHGLVNEPAALHATRVCSPISIDGDSSAKAFRTSRNCGTLIATSSSWQSKMNLVSKVPESLLRSHRWPRINVTRVPSL